jgi:anthranilate phosphoribosyltransferase
MREFATRVEVKNSEHLVDIVGTGGDASHTFNISTAAMFVAAAAGAKVAKHGGRGVSSTSGSADVLEQLGVNINLPPARVAQAIETLGLGFMFAPNHHAAMKHAAPVRKEMGVRTLFNILGPLTNPAGAPNQLLGVFHRDLVGILVRVLQRLGAQHVLVVHGQASESTGLDEISLSGTTWIGELKDGEIREYSVTPEDFGLPRCELSQLTVASSAESKARVLEILNNQSSPSRDIVLLNTGAALYAANRADSIKHGIELARHALASGAARQKLHDLVQFSQNNAPVV